MKPKVLKTEAEYTEALAKVERLMDARAGSAKEEAPEIRSLLVAQYEDQHFPIALPDPVAAIKFRMEQEGLRQKDLEKYFPGNNRVLPPQPRSPPYPARSATPPAPPRSTTVSFAASRKGNQGCSALCSVWRYAS